MTDELTSQDVNSPRARGERLRRIRNLANLSRKVICESDDININSLKGWEIGRYGGLTRNGAEKVIKRVEEEGVFVTLDWLMHEIGQGPVVKTDYRKVHEADPVVPPTSDEQAIAQELSLFKQLHQGAVDYIVSDDAMQPYYKIGEYVAGHKCLPEHFSKLINYDVIAYLQDGQILLRTLRAANQAGQYNLICANVQTTVAEPIIYNAELVSVAPVIWHRRPQIIL